MVVVVWLVYCIWKGWTLRVIKMVQIEKKDQEEKKTFPKLLIIIAGAVLLLATGAGATYYFLKASFSQLENEKTAREERVKKEEYYFDLSKPLIVDFSKDSAVHLIQVSISFLVEEAEAVDSLKKHEPMIRNNLLMIISAEGAEHLKTREGKEQLRSAILEDVSGILKKMAGKGQVKEVFFTSFVMQ